MTRKSSRRKKEEGEEHGKGVFVKCRKGSAATINGVLRFSNREAFLVMEKVVKKIGKVRGFYAQGRGAKETPREI